MLRHITHFSAVCMALLVGLSASPTSYAQPKAGSRSAQPSARAARPITQMIVRYKDGQTAVMPAADPLRMQALSARGGAKLTYQRPMSGGAHVLALPKGGLPRSEALALAKRLQAEPGVAYAEPDLWMYPAAEPTDTYYVGTGNVPRGQWHMKDPALALGGLYPAGAANFPTAWNSSTGSGVIVAVIDGGVVAHADLGSNVIAGYDFVTDAFIANDGDGRDSDPTDPGDWVTSADLTNAVCSGAAVSNSSWHGTHVAGTVAALANGVGVVGGAYGAKVLNVRALGKCGGYTSDIIDAMRWAAGLSVSGVASNTANIAKIINLSLGATGVCLVSFQSAITEIRNRGAVVVVATGNEYGAVDQPANCSGVIAVTANTYEGDNADYANIGAETTLSAPGGGDCTLSTFSTCTTLPSGDVARYIWSTRNDGTTVAGADTLGGMAGTSMAAPHVSAAAALLLSWRSTLTPAEVSQYLTSTSRPHPTGSYCANNPGVCGSGLLDVSAAITALAVAPSLAVSASTDVALSGSEVVTLTGSATAQSGGSTTFTYVWTQVSGPTPTDWMTSANAASFTAPSPGGLMVFRLTVTDGSNLVTSNTVSVRSNSAPSLVDPGVQTGTAGTSLSFTLSASDPENDSLTYVASGLPSGATLNAATGMFTWSNPVEGSHSFSVYASDGYTYGNSASLTVNLTVSAAPAGGGGGAIGGLGLALLLAAGWAARRNRLPH